MEYNLNASVVSTQNYPSNNRSTEEPHPVKIERTGSMSKMVAERNKQLKIVDEGMLLTQPSIGPLLGSEPKVPLYERKRREAMELNRKATKKLIIVLLTSFVFIAIEIAGGIMAHSIAIMSDAAHIASDVIGFGISICALKIAHRQANKSFTFGYHRVEIVGAFCSIFTIWIMTVWLFYEATQRLINGSYEVGGTIMLTVACMSFVFNLIQIKILHSGEGGHVHAGG